MLREEDRRDSIWSDTPALMMEFQTGKNTPMWSVVFANSEIAPIDSYVSFNADGAKNAYTTWKKVIIHGYTDIMPEK